MHRLPICARRQASGIELANLSVGWKRLGVAVTTVRTHLTHIFEKTGVHRQAELISFLLRDETA